MNLSEADRACEDLLKGLELGSQAEKVQDKNLIQIHYLKIWIMAKLESCLA